MEISEDKFHDECGVFGIFDHPEAAKMTYLGLYALQHRGQESAGIAITDGDKIVCERGMGQVADIFRKEKLDALRGHRAIGHVRYSTAGGSAIKNAQPIFVDCHRGEIAIGHNGNLVNAHIIRDELEREGTIFTTTSDTEVVLHMIARSRQPRFIDALIDTLSVLKGAYSFVFLTKDMVIAARDPWGFRPLCLGKLAGSYVVASETCALDLLDADYIRDVQPGEIVIISEKGIESRSPFAKQRRHSCIFELVYFARPDSNVFERNVYNSRYHMGRELAREAPVDADIVVPVPDSGVVAALGYSAESGIPIGFGLIRNHYVGRTFIEPKKSIRHFGVKVKLNPVRSILEGKRVILIDDSIVRGNTSQKIVRMVRSAGAREVHFRISCPPTIGPCYYGIDTPTEEELIASHKTVPEIADFIGVDSLQYLSLDGLLKATADPEGSMFCTACYTKKYPVPLPVESSQQLRLFQKAAESKEEEREVVVAKN
ncbi:MAG TPA: amidophosphoribosyltransferase [Acidobacteriota bacterium]|nr:amidophosphoribosyltransferase [Acidobacteriota bacterium]